MPMSTADKPVELHEPCPQCGVEAVWSISQYSLDYTINGCACPLEVADDG